MWLNQIRIYGHLIKFSHTIFALPFALAAVLLAHRQHPVSWFSLFWIILAMAGARSAAMGFNRLADYQYDRINPRTAGRPHATGQISKQALIIFITLSSALLIISAGMLGKLCLLLSVPLLLILFFYSFTKRFTSCCHLFLGFAIGLAPLGAWIAVTGSIDVRILLLTAALMTYIAGFDILYACQDVDFDREARLFSIPARWGIDSALQVSSLLHALAFLALLALYFAFDLGMVYLVFLAVISFLLVLEHKLVQPHRLDKINIAFFHVNSAISVLLFLAVFTDTWIF
ncbi:UbiA-like polyprenyltransferase [Desulfoferrobacter suflitae]|uniref:UbiA-like polyprenyltransferase n=1 Tax=Desulfoferrobacter suflitae TaxID=2865782 RepID=UPI00216429D6|nr:UbiA-like polyprenyltransferase [Desulfoferrobacter suflitae]MCK8602120.1 putative 4-hydroxybenzoate polyprenyltransferase [Desulfoferrobacter suflitae]